MNKKIFFNFELREDKLKYLILKLLKYFITLFCSSYISSCVVCTTVDVEFSIFTFLPIFFICHQICSTFNNYKFHSEFNYGIKYIYSKL